jgi:hypothetical protein
MIMVFSTVKALEHTLVLCVGVVVPATGSDDSITLIVSTK